MMERKKESEWPRMRLRLPCRPTSPLSGCVYPSTTSVREIILQILFLHFSSQEVGKLVAVIGDEVGGWCLACSMRLFCVVGKSCNAGTAKFGDSHGASGALHVIRPADTSSVVIKWYPHTA